MQCGIARTQGSISNGRPGTLVPMLCVLPSCSRRPCGFYLPNPRGQAVEQPVVYGLGLVRYGLQHLVGKEAAEHCINRWQLPVTKGIHRCSPCCPLCIRACCRRRLPSQLVQRCCVLLLGQLQLVGCLVRRDDYREARIRSISTVQGMMLRRKQARATVRYAAVVQAAACLPRRP